MKIKAKNIIFIAAYCILAFLFLEAAARLVVFKTPFLDMQQRLDSESLYRLKLVKSRNPYKYLTPRIITTYNSARGWVHKPNLSSDRWGELHTNSKGMRGREEYPYEKTGNKIRILAIGDSLTFGYEAADNQTYPYYLENALKGSEVLNTGVGGYGHDQMLLYLKEEGIRYNPDIVILGFVSGNMSRNMLNFQHLPKPKFEYVHGELRLINVPVPTAASLVKGEFFRLKIVDLFSIIKDKYFRKSGWEREKERITEGILDEMVKTIRACHAKVLFVHILTPKEVASIDTFKVKAQEDYFLQYCLSRGVPYLSTHAAFSATIKNGINLRTSGHWDARGNYIIAQAISDYLKNNND